MRNWAACFSSKSEMSCWSMVTEPEVGGRRVPMTLRRVVLPDPDGPVIAEAEPAGKVRFSPSRTVMVSPGVSKETWRSWISIIGFGIWFIRLR